MKRCLALLLALAWPLMAHASGGETPLKRAKDEDWMVQNGFAGFLQKHPDMLHHRVGSVAYHRGDYPKAMKHFRKAARYADKPSQALISGMFWSGQGVAQDRATAYAWADLAAERDYPEFAKLRDGMWVALSEAERKRALQVGKQIYAEYGDDVAQPRILATLRRGRKEVTGSRTGATTAATRIMALRPGGISEDDVIDIDSSEFYAATYWQPEHYFKWREVQWREEFKRGQTPNVDVGELQSVPTRADSSVPPKPD